PSANPGGVGRTSRTCEGFPMAVFVRASEAADSVLVVALPVSTPQAPPLYASTQLRERLANALPLVASVLLASTVFWMPLHTWSAQVFAILMLGLDRKSVV